MCGQVVVQLLDSGFMLHGGEPVRRARPGVGGIDTTFTAAGAELRVPAGRLRLSLSGIQRGSELIRLAPAAPVAAQNRVLYRRGWIIQASCSRHSEPTIKAAFERYEEERRLEAIVARAVAEKKCTPDVGGTLGTRAVGDWVLGELAHAF